MERGHTCYVVPTGPDTIFSKKEGITIAEILDGTSNTILAIETKPSVPWTKPDDVAYDSKQPLPKLGGVFEQGFLTLFADGSVRFISSSVDQIILRALFTKAGQEVIGGL